MGKLWGGRFTKQTNHLVDEYTASIGFDQALAEEDIQGSLAHVTMLGKCGIVPQEDVETIKAGLQTVLDKIRRGEIEFSVADEDIHMNVEKNLIAEIGPVGGKLHTGRSRNDQVATDMHLYLRKRVVELAGMLHELQKSLIGQARDNLDTIIPGYTHLQRAQPILFAHHLMAYVSMFQRDIERLMDSYKRINVLPLGAGALAGTTFPIDRHFVAEQLQFDRVYENSLDAVSDRDFIVEFLSHASIIMMHLSRLSEELVLWSSTEFNFIELDDAFCTGSSIMPQKKNPDVPELVRGKTGRVYGNLMGLLTVLKSLPLAYNKDMQEDKEGMFDTVATLEGALQLFAPMIATMKVNKSRMREAVNQDFSNATDIADFLVGKGLPFRQAHEVIGKTVLYCIQQGKYLLDLTMEEFQQFSPLFDDTIYEVLRPETVVNARNVYGGTATDQVAEAIKRGEVLLSMTEQWLAEHV
ncbi:argininosuccinate lyase [Paenibacillus cellulositrophicus]|uniref:Argininosuccinate lyase n=3 Tax=Paenibacillus TaxID=44249 RepID=A0A839TWN3_9BACL|nr:MULTISPECIES: argininosuccinate lyase [Paenibacillus]MCM3000695.1 argininosuccinate lyase [Paenibacillus cellulositrophicus]MBB3130913.1 argininosuccinate lyase [Paenibacillus rhizosphaerae]MBJ9993137.1 argininosuccinate lyase [Paenibacillus sp. S28]OXL87065.1 argininosuccinate lyase [Paenibacillus sp. SSG-1]RED33804.1 argininosuccinate lyase [Paenibacillus sp. VMFN-D1]